MASGRKKYDQAGKTGERYSFAVRPEGILCFILLVGTGIAAILTGNNSLVLLFSFLVAIAISGLWLGFRNLKSLVVYRSLPDEVFAGQELEIGVRVENRATYPCFGVDIFEDFDRNRVIGPVSLDRIPAGASCCSHYLCLFERRGESHFRQMQLRSRFPLSFIELRRTLPSPAVLTVYPGLADLRGMRPKIIPEKGFVTEQSMSNYGSETFKEWRPGGRVSRIAWKLSARRGKWIERHASYGASRQKYSLRLLLTPEMTAKQWEKKISQTAALAVRYISLGNAVSLWSGETCLVPTGCGPAQRRKVLSALAVVRRKA